MTVAIFALALCTLYTQDMYIHHLALALFMRHSLQGINTSSEKSDKIDKIMIVILFVLWAAIHIPLRILF